MRNKLQSMYLLQLLDTELDELRELRGDLPDAVEHLEAEVHDLQFKIEDSSATLKTGATERSRKEKETLELLDKIDKYKSQQLHVKNNREYDALTHEIELSEETIKRYEKEIEMFADEADLIRTRKTEFEAKLQELSAALVEKTEELKSVLATTAEEEDRLVKQREKALKGIEKRDLEMYARIRKAKVKAVAPIRRGSCSGCYNVVPPQKILEIRKNSELFMCEHCGRILISEELAVETRIDR